MTPKRDSSHPGPDHVGANWDVPPMLRVILPDSRRKEWVWMGVLLLVALAIRLHYAPHGGYFYDLNAYVNWGQTVDAHFFTVYSVFPTANYPPLAMYLCAFGVTAVSIINPILHIPVPYNVFLSGELATLEKLPAMICDLILTAVFFGLARRTLSFWWSFGFAAVYALSPAVILISADWGQMDGIFALCLVLAFWFAIKRQPVGAGILFGLALMLKPQPIVLTPVLLVFIWHSGWRAVLKSGAAIVATCVIICLPYLIPPKIQLFVMLQNIVNSVTPFSSSYAYNMWWGLGREFRHASDPVIGPFSATLIGWIIFFTVLTGVCLLIWRVPNPVTLLVGAAVVMYAFFDFTTGQHERYLFPALPLFLFAAMWQRRYLVWYGIATAACYLNMMSIIYRRYRPTSILNRYPLEHMWILRSFSWLNVLCFCVVAALLVRHYWPDIWGTRENSPAAPLGNDLETLKRPSIKRVNPAIN